MLRSLDGQAFELNFLVKTTGFSVFRKGFMLEVCNRHQVSFRPTQHIPFITLLECLFSRIHSYQSSSWSLEIMAPYSTFDYGTGIEICRTHPITCAWSLTDNNFHWNIEGYRLWHWKKKLTHILIENLKSISIVGRCRLHSRLLRNHMVDTRVLIIEKVQVAQV